MKLNKLFLTLTLAASLFAGTASALDKPTRYVNDYAHVLSPQVADKLNDQLAQVERDTSNQVVVVIDNNNTSGQSIEDAAIDYARQWGIGQKNKDNGVLFLVFIKDHQMKLEVGNGLQGSLTDIESKQITASLKPYFRSNDFNGGFTNAVNQIVAKVGREGNKGGGRTVVEQQKDQQAHTNYVVNKNPTVNQSFDHKNASSDGAGFGGVILVILLIMAVVAAFLVYLVKKVFGDSDSETVSSDYTPSVSTYTPPVRSTYNDYDSTPRPYSSSRSYSTPTPAPVTPTPSSHSSIGSFAAGAAAGVAGDEIVRSLCSSRRRRHDDDDDDSSSRSSSSSSYTPSSYSSSSSDDSSSSSSSSSSYSSSSSDSSSSSWSDSSSSSDFGGGGGDFSGGGSTDSW